MAKQSTATTTLQTTYRAYQTLNLKKLSDGFLENLTFEASLITLKNSNIKVLKICLLLFSE